MNSRVVRVAPLLFGSGTCALIYQVAWLREMRFIFGASTAASAAVLAIFMGGLGLGGALLGPRADRHPQPLVFYGQLELMIAISAAVTPALVWLTRYAYVATGGSVVLGLFGASVVRLVLAAVVLSVPTLLMGGTLPAAAKAVETDDDASRSHLAVLYGSNTLGAVAGVVVSTFFLLELLGTRMTLWSACLLNLCVALGAMLIANTAGFRGRPRRQSSAGTSRLDESAVVRERTPSPAEATVSAQSRKHQKLPGRPDPSAAPQSSRKERRPVETASGRLFTLAAAGVIGFAFLLMELVWYRMMAPLLGGSTFTFGLILAVALLGIGLGGGTYALLGKSRPATLAGFAFSCILEAACIGYPYALGDRVAVLALLLRPLGALGFYGLALGWTLVTALVVLPAAFVAGVQFPLLIGLLGRGGEHVGRDTGLAYAWNTVGAIIGSLAGGFGLMAALSAPGTWRVVVGLLVLLGLVASVLSVLMERRWVRVVPPVVIAAAALLMLRATGPTAIWRHSAIGAGRADQSDASPSRLHAWANDQRRFTLWEADGVESSVALDNMDSLAFKVNGKVDGNALKDAPTQVMAGLVGAILHGNPKRALVVGLGTGSTAGWLGAIPSMERVDVVELEPSVLTVARACAAVNHNVLENPKVHIFIGDAREVLRTTPERYDVIFSEPSNPYRSGVASLYTREFYQAVAARLADGGIFSQWLQAYEVDSQTIRMVYATLAAVFPNVETWQTGYGVDLLLVASAAPLNYDVPALRARVRQEPFKTALARVWQATDVEGLLSRYVAGPGLTREIARQQGGVLNTDDRTLVEFEFARTVGLDSFSLLELVASADARHENRPGLTGGDVDWEKVEDQRVNMIAITKQIWEPVKRELGSPRAQRALAQNLYLAGSFEDALKLWHNQSEEPTGSVELAVIAESLADAGDNDALKYIDQLRAFEPIEADVALARLHWKQEHFEEATHALETAFTGFQHDPWPLRSVIGNGLVIAADIATKDKALGLRLYHTLKTPFVVFALESVRMATRYEMAKELDFEKLCVEALAPFERAVLWDRDFLSDRVRCYQVNHHPNTAQAVADLAAYAAEQPIAFDRGTPP